MSSRASRRRWRCGTSREKGDGKPLSRGAWQGAYADGRSRARTGADRRRWQKASAGHGRVVVLRGEGGIGKSRITQFFWERLEPQPSAPPVAVLVISRQQRVAGHPRKSSSPPISRPRTAVNKNARNWKHCSDSRKRSARLEFRSSPRCFRSPTIVSIQS